MVNIKGITWWITLHILVAWPTIYNVWKHLVLLKSLTIHYIFIHLLLVVGKCQLKGIENANPNRMNPLCKSKN